jgi:nicotinamidase-related amidase
MTSALIIGDVQVGIVEALFPGADAVLAPLAAVLPVARRTGTPVIYVRAALRPDQAEVPARNANITWMFANGDLFQESSPATAIHPDIAPVPGEAVITKRRGSAFAGTDLEAILRARGINEIALAGVATSGVVLHTLVDATDRDYAVTVLRDGCADPEPDVHEFLVDRVFPGRGASVLECREWGGNLFQPARPHVTSSPPSR